MTAFFHDPIVRAVLLGFWAAFSVDLFEWMKTPGWWDAGFNMGLATKRWAVGALAGLLGGLGLGAV